MIDDALCKAFEVDADGLLGAEGADVFGGEACGMGTGALCRRLVVVPYSKRHVVSPPSGLMSALRSAVVSVRSLEERPLDRGWLKIKGLGQRFGGAVFVADEKAVVVSDARGEAGDFGADLSGSGTGIGRGLGAGDAVAGFEGVGGRGPVFGFFDVFEFAGLDFAAAAGSTSALRVAEASLGEISAASETPG